MNIDELFAAIDDRTTQIRCIDDSDMNAGQFRIESGEFIDWTFEIFMDCGECDYVEWVKMPDGTKCGFGQLTVAQQNWTPYDPIKFETCRKGDRVYT